MKITAAVEIPYTLEIIDYILCAIIKFYLLIKKKHRPLNMKLYNNLLTTKTKHITIKMKGINK